MKKTEFEANGIAFVIVTRDDFRTLCDLAEDRLDQAALDKALAEIDGDEAELLTETDMAELDRLGPVRFWRTRRRMTTAALARQVGISRSYLAEIELGRKDGGFGCMKRIADALGVRLDDLVWTTGS